MNVVKATVSFFKVLAYSSSQTIRFFLVYLFSVRFIGSFESRNFFGKRKEVWKAESLAQI